MTTQDPAFVAALQRIRQWPGDQTAWDVFYRVTSRRIRGHLFSLGARGSSELDDLCQAVLLRFYEYCPWRRSDWRDLPEPPILFGYLRKITFHVFIDSRGPMPVELEDEAGHIGLEDLQGPNIEEIDLTISKFWSSLNTVEQSLLLLLRDGRSRQDIADLLGIEYSAAAVRVHRLRSKMRELARQM